MDTVGLRELRQDASGLVRRAEAGEEITITISGRPSARLVPTVPAQWCSWDHISSLFDGPGDGEWEELRELLDDSVADPWVERDHVVDSWVER